MDNFYHTIYHFFKSEWERKRASGYYINVTSMHILILYFLHHSTTAVVIAVGSKSSQTLRGNGIIKIFNSLSFSRNDGSVAWKMNVSLTTELQRSLIKNKESVSRLSLWLFADTFSSWIISPSHITLYIAFLLNHVKFLETGNINFISMMMRIWRLIFLTLLFFPDDVNAVI